LRSIIDDVTTIEKFVKIMTKTGKIDALADTQRISQGGTGCTIENDCW